MLTLEWNPFFAFHWPLSCRPSVWHTLPTSMNVSRHSNLVTCVPTVEVPLWPPSLVLFTPHPNSSLTHVTLPYYLVLIPLCIYFIVAGSFSVSDPLEWRCHEDRGLAHLFIVVCPALRKVVAHGTPSGNIGFTGGRVVARII